MPVRLAQRLFSIGLVAAFTLNCYPAQACSPEPDFKGPDTNFELVQKTDVILIGTVTGQEGEDPFDSKIIVRPDNLLKGEKLPATVSISGFLSGRTFRGSETDMTVYATRSDPFDLWRPNAEVWIGGCARQTFFQGGQLLLFFDKEGAELRNLQPTFGRGAEDVSGIDALWAKAVAIYTRISSLPETEQKPALAAEMNRLRKSGFLNDENILLADDIERQLAGVRPVSDFMVGSATPAEVRWINNIVNMSYHARVPKMAQMKVSEQPHPSWKFFWLVGIFLLISVISYAAFRRYRAHNSP